RQDESSAYTSCLYRAVFGRSRSFFFFFQAEDGIRDRNVTGVQTCALPIWRMLRRYNSYHRNYCVHFTSSIIEGFLIDRKSTRLNSSHVSISYAVFCLKKKT